MADSKVNDNDRKQAHRLLAAYRGKRPMHVPDGGVAVLGGTENPAAQRHAEEAKREEAKEKRERAKLAKKDVVKEATKGPRKLKYRNPNPLLPQHPSRLCIAGATGTGKSFWLIDVLQHPDMPWDRVLWVSPARSLRQPILQALKKKMGPRLEFIEADAALGPVGEERAKLEKLIKDGREAKTDPEGKPIKGDLGMQQLVVIDDLMNVSKDSFFTDLFVSGRHDNLSVAELSQRVFLPGKGNRTRRLNCDYFILFHFSALSEVRNLFAQLDPENQERVVHAYKRSVAGRPVGSYFMVDLISPRSTDPERRKLKYRDASLTKVYANLSE